MGAYKIKSDYRPYPTSKNNTVGDDRDYWNEAQIRTNKYYQWQVYEYAGKLIAPKDIVYDVGCGPADKLINLVRKTSCSAVGLDQPSIASKLQDRHRGKASFYAVDFELDNPPKSLEQFQPSVIICSDVIEHMLDPDKLLNFLKKIAAKNTVFIISTPDRDRLRGYSCTSAEKPEHIREWNREEFCAYLDDRGFEIIETKLLAPLKLTYYNIRTFFTIFLRQITGGDGKRFYYNHVVRCKLKEE